MNDGRQLLFAAALMALFGYGCAQSEPVDAPIDGPAGASGGGGAMQTPAGVGGEQGAAGSRGTDTGGFTGAGGRFAEGGSTGTGTGSTTGTGGTTGTAGTAEGGGTTGTTGGTRGSGGTTGTAGAGGRGGGRGGATGATGTGGSAGTGKGGSTFTQVYSAILSVYCTGSGCHSPGTAGGISFASKASAYTSLLNNYVVPGDSADSDFYFAVSTGEMPKGKAKLSSANIATIKSWIDAGAVDN